MNISTSRTVAHQPLVKYAFAPCEASSVLACMNGNIVSWEQGATGE